VSKKRKLPRKPTVDYEALQAALMLSTFQASILLGLSEKTVCRLVVRGELIGRRVGRLLRIPRTSIDSFLKRDHLTGEENRKADQKAPAGDVYVPPPDPNAASPRGSKPSRTRGSR
jgi:excisionase family DNA binding protein